MPNIKPFAFLFSHEVSRTWRYEWTVIVIMS